MDGRTDRAHVRRLVLIVLVVAIATIVALLLVGSDDADAPEGARDVPATSAGATT